MRRMNAWTLLCLGALAFPVATTHAATSPDPTAPALALPKPVEKRLENGLRVIVFPSARLPIVQMQLLVPAGAASEPDSLPGLAALTAQLVRRGTTSRTSEQFDAEAAQIGASFVSNATRDYAQLACAVSSPRMEQALELMSDAALGAVFGDEAFEAGRREVVGTLRQQSQDVGAIAEERMWAAAVAEHPYAHESRGDIDVLIATKPEMVRTFHREHWRPDRAVLAIAGDVTPDRAFAAATEWFGRWAGRSVTDVAHAAPVAHAGVRVIDIPDAPYTELRMVALAPARGDATWPAWQLLTHGLEHGGLPAGFHARLESQREASLLVVSGAAPNDSAGAWAVRVRRALSHAATLNTDADAFARLRSDAAAAFPLQLETLGALLSQWQAADAAALPPDALEKLPATLLAVRPDAYAAAVQTLTRGLTIVAAGPGEKLRAGLAPLGKSEPLSAVETRIRRSSAAAPAPAQMRAGKVAIAAAVLAHGGAAKLAAARSVVNEGDMTLFAGGQELQGNFSLVRQDPDRLSFATKLLRFENRQTLVGDKGWSLSLSDSASMADLDSTAVATLRATLHGDLVHLLRAAQSASDLAVRSKDMVGARICDVADFTTSDGLRARLYIDRVSHRVLCAESAPDEAGQWHDRRVYTDFRQVGGLWLPFNEERTVSGERVSVFATRVAAVNKVLGEDLFLKPEVLHGQLLPRK
jgi:zinc protease